MGRTGWAGDVEGEDAGRKIAQPERRPGLGLDREVAVISQSKGYTRETMFVEEGAESLLSFPRNHAGDRIYLCVDDIVHENFYSLKKPFSSSLLIYLMHLTAFI